MNSSIWVLTTEYNQYDQYGAYFVAAWAEKPSKEELGKACGMQEVESARFCYLSHVWNGGGRHKYEDQWYNLKEHKLDASGIFKEVE